ncbi:ankyrin repeat protein [Ancylostoma ceylanicum]|uniref:Ankyrin repeat protein n=1 Tax=Ancylostoma ceylanicum TaxID=53326 RepID=A0A0D6LJD3_9BILA|nr:ankyrin repeat protein [Ancylostoma ceylanicum]
MIKVLQKAGGDAFIDDKVRFLFLLRTRTALDFWKFCRSIRITLSERNYFFQAKIQAIHKAVETGNLRAVRLLTDRKKLALCRDSRGLSPLHKAIVFDRADIAKYLIRNYPHSVNAMDQVPFSFCCGFPIQNLFLFQKKRTPLHYAAAYRDGGYLYKMMRKSGADPNIYDCNGRPAKYYLKHPGEIDLSAMRLDTKAALKQVSLLNALANNPFFLDI